MNISSDVYDIHYIHERVLTLMTWWFQHADLFQNEVMPLLHGTLQLLLMLNSGVEEGVTGCGRKFFLYLNVESGGGDDTLLYIPGIYMELGHMGLHINTMLDYTKTLSLPWTKDQESLYAVTSYTYIV